VVNVAISALVVIVQLILKPEKSFKRILFFLVIVLIIVFVVAPRLDDFTSGALSERYSDFDTTGRAEIIEADLELFEKSKLTGVGVGMSARFRRFMPGTAAHTEYSRLLAEHGIFGIVAIVLLIFMFVRAWFKAPDTISKAWTLSLSAWAFVEMSHAAMRVASIGFVFGWALCELQSGEAERVDAPEYFDEPEQWNQEALNRTYRGRRLIRSERRSPRTS
jgi:O-antigen ligase